MEIKYLIKDIIIEGSEILKNSDIVDAENDSWLLAEHVFGINRQSYYMNPKAKVDERQRNRYISLVKRRADKTPLQYITGEQEFMGLNFKVNEKVLIPRQDTELLVEKVAEFINKQNATVKLLDLCTGSGCIAISIDKLCKNADVTASDISYTALQMAKDNNEFNQTNIKFIKSNLFEEINEKFDIIVSNPPYIRTQEIYKLMEEVKDHEPIIALDGSSDGLKFYRLIAQESEDYLNPEGMLFLEIGYDQGKEVPEILERYRFKDIKVYKDLLDNDRVVVARKE